MRLSAQGAGRGEHGAAVFVAVAGAVGGSFLAETEVLLHEHAVHVVRRGGREELDPAGARRHHAQLFSFFAGETFFAADVRGTHQEPDRGVRVAFVGRGRARLVLPIDGNRQTTRTLARNPRQRQHQGVHAGSVRRIEGDAAARAQDIEQLAEVRGGGRPRAPQRVRVRAVLRRGRERAGRREAREARGSRAGEPRERAARGRHPGRALISVAQVGTDNEKIFLGRHGKTPPQSRARGGRVGARGVRGRSAPRPRVRCLPPRPPRRRRTGPSARPAGSCAPRAEATSAS